MKIEQKFWMCVQDDWSGAGINQYVGPRDDDEVTFMVSLSLNRLIQFLVYVSYHYPESTIIFNKELPTGDPMILGGGTYGKNTYGVKQ